MWFNNIDFTYHNGKMYQLYQWNKMIPMWYTFSILTVQEPSQACLAVYNKKSTEDAILARWISSYRSSGRFFIWTPRILPGGSNYNKVTLSTSINPTQPGLKSTFVKLMLTTQTALVSKELLGFSWLVLLHLHIQTSLRWHFSERFCAHFFFSAPFLFLACSYFASMKLPYCPWI